MAILGRGIPIPVIYIRAVNVWPFVDPASVPNLFCWYDASVGSSFTPTDATGNITAWNDLSGNARHLDTVQLTPSRDGTVLNGLPTVAIAAGEAIYRTQSSDLGAAACSIFAVVKIATNVAGFVVTEASTTDATHAFRPMESIVTSGNFQILERAGGAQTLDDDAVNITGAFKVLRTTDTGTSLIRAVDGVTTGAAFSHTDLNPTTNTFALGALWRGSPVFSGGLLEYAEVIAYDRVLEPAEITAVEDYLTDKWLTGATPLLVADATHAHTAEATVLVQHQVLTVADTVHGHTVEAVTLTQHQVLTVAAATHAHSAEPVALTQHHVLTVAAATHGHSAANVVLEVAGQLAVQDATHGHTAAGVALIQHHVLVVADATHGHTAANITLAVGVVTLVVADATHSHTVAAVALVQHQVLVVADATHAQSAGPVALTQHHVLAVDNAVHAHLAAVVIFNVLILVGPLTTGTVRHPRTTVLEAHARSTGTVRHPRTTEAP